MTDQPKQGNNETPEGHQPTLRLPDHQPEVPRQPAPSSGQEQGQSATQQFAQPGSPEQSEQPGYPQQPYAGQQPGHDHYGRPAPDQGQFSSPYPPIYGQAGQPGQTYGQTSPYAQPGSYNAYGQPSYYPVSPAPKTLSIASMCCGIAALVGLGFFLLPQLAAVILGHLALRREPAGRGMAIAGLVMGYVGIAVTVLVLVIVGLVIGTARNSGYNV